MYHSDAAPRFQPLVLATVVDPGGFPTRTGRPVGWWRRQPPLVGDRFHCAAGGCCLAMAVGNSLLEWRDLGSESC